MEYQPINTAPTETAVMIKTASGKEFGALFVPGFVGDNEVDCFGWVSATEGECPPCWTDDTCWASNAEGIQSDQPVGWKYK